MASSFAIPLDDVTLARARRGELGALESVFRAFEAPVYTLARRMLRDPHEAEEVLQETFLEVVRSAARFRGDGPFWAWLRRIAVSKALMRLRGERGRAALPLPLDSAGNVVELPGTGDAPVRIGARLDLEAALAALPPVSRAVVWLHDVEGYTHDEIAALLGRTPSFSKSQLARSHARLRALLESEVHPCTRASNS